MIAAWRLLDEPGATPLMLPARRQLFLVRQEEEGFQMEADSPLLAALVSRCDGLRIVPVLAQEVLEELPEVSAEEFTEVLERLLQDGTLEGLVLTRRPG